MTTKVSNIRLPDGVQARGLSREQAAAYLGISPCHFDKAVAKGLLPKARPILGRLTWDRLALDNAYEALPDSDGKPPQSGRANSWDAA